MFQLSSQLERLVYIWSSALAVTVLLYPWFMEEYSDRHTIGDGWSTTRVILGYLCVNGHDIQYDKAWLMLSSFWSESTYLLRRTISYCN